MGNRGGSEEVCPQGVGVVVVCVLIGIAWLGLVLLGPLVLGSRFRKEG
jgi:hypothetical protein